MELKIVRRFQYRGADVFIRNWNEYWEFLAIWRGNVYSHVLEVRKQQHRRNKPYADQERESIIKVMSDDATTVINTLIFRRKQEFKGLFKNPFNIFKHEKPISLPDEGQGKSKEDANPEVKVSEHI